MMKSLSAGFLAAVLGMAGVARPAWAQQAAPRGPTLAAVIGRGQLVCGVHPGSPGFSLPDSRGEWRGLNVDLCRAIAAAVLGDPGKARLVPVNALQRFTALQSGEVDVLTWNATLTMSRSTSMGMTFSGANFYDGQGILVRKASGVTSATDLDGATICVEPGTTAELNLADYFRAKGMRLTPVVIDGVDQNVAAYLAGRCDGYSIDTSQLAALRATALGDPDDHVILPERLSKEPLGPLVRQGDEQWLNVVKWTLMALVAAEELKIGQANVDDLAKTSTDPEVRRFLGLQPELGLSLGLDPDWARRAVRAVGNYGESFDRNLGSRSSIKLERGLNRLWTDGGLMYAIPFR